MQENFEPCPFCFSHEIKCCHTLFAHYLQCNHCKACSPKSRQLKDAINAWNKLSNKMEQIDTIKSTDLLKRMSKMESLVSQLQLEVDLQPPT